MSLSFFFFLKTLVLRISDSCLHRYDSSKTFSQNVELTDPIVSRFDVLCVVKVKSLPLTAYFHCISWGCY